jgi:uncharacterized protein
MASGIAVLVDERAITIHQPAAEEDRWVTIGQDAFTRVLVVVYTWRAHRIRIISARRAMRRERAQYEESL